MVQNGTLFDEFVDKIIRKNFSAKQLGKKVKEGEKRPIFDFQNTENFG